MQFFFRGLLVAGITYFFKLGHINNGLHIYCSKHGPPTGRRKMGLLRAVETMGLLRAVETMGLLRGVDTMGLLRGVDTMGLLRAVSSWAFYGPYDRLAKHGPITDHILAVNGLELKSSVHGPTITGRR